MALENVFQNTASKTDPIQRDLHPDEQAAASGLFDRELYAAYGGDLSLLNDSDSIERTLDVGSLPEAAPIQNIPVQLDERSRRLGTYGVGKFLEGDQETLPRQTEDTNK